MKIEGITAEIRPRNAWEAIDLGCVLTRRHYGDILRAWCATVVPLWVVILAIMHQYPFWAMAVIWWLKPVAERVPLFVLSRALFGEPLRRRELWRQWPLMIGRRVWGTLFWRRLSPVRTLVAPVVELEEWRERRLLGAKFRQRRNAITAGAGVAAFWMQAIALLVLHSSWTGLLLFAYLMVPARHQPDLRLLWDQWGDPGAAAPAVATWAGIALYLACLSLVTPFLVGGGFGLYLNSRTRLEGWDVELAFRRMGNRLRESGLAACIPVCLAMLIAGPEPVLASEPPAAAKTAQSPEETIHQVLSDADFEVHKIKIHRFKDREKPEPLPGLHLPFLEHFGRVITWVILGSLGLFVVYLVTRALTMRIGGPSSLAGPRTARVKTVMGLNLEEEKLPPDLLSAARTLWDRGEHEGATRLLYQGALSWLVNRAGVPIRESDTEVDCLRRVRDDRRPESGYFDALTRVWVLTAYGKRRGSEEEMTGLFEGWPFGGSADPGKA